MLLLTATTQTLELITGTTATTYVRVHYSDFVTTPAFTHGRQQTAAISSATTTTICAAPSGSATRRIKQVSIINTHATASQTVQVQIDESPTNYPITGTITLLAGEALCYEEQRGWYALDVLGQEKSAIYPAPPVVPAIAIGPYHAASGTTSVRSCTTNGTLARYLGPALRQIPAGTSVTFRYRITTAAATITWAELGLAKGPPILASNPTLTPVGFVDASAIINSTGLKSTAVSVSTGQVINPGEHVWVIIGNQATTAAVVRAFTIADDLGMGLTASGGGATRPSTIIGVATAFTADTTSDLMPWMAVAF